MREDIRTFFGCYSFPDHVLSRAGQAEIGLPGDNLVTTLRAEYADAEVGFAQGVPIL